MTVILISTLVAAGLETLKYGWGSYQGHKTAKKESEARQQLLDWLNTGAFPEIDPTMYKIVGDVYEKNRLDLLSKETSKKYEELAAGGYLPTGVAPRSMAYLTGKAGEEIAGKRSELEAEKKRTEYQRELAKGQAIAQVYGGQYQSAQQAAADWQNMMANYPAQLANMFQNYFLYQAMTAEKPTPAVPSKTAEEMAQMEVEKILNPSAYRVAGYEGAMTGKPEIESFKY